jgi:hypothetical protein
MHSTYVEVDRNADSGDLEVYVDITMRAAKVGRKKRWPPPVNSHSYGLDGPFSSMIYRFLESLSSELANSWSLPEAIS